MNHVLNILIKTTNTTNKITETELYPIAFKTLDEIDYELQHEGYTKLLNNKPRIKSEYIWEEENLIKKATIKYTTIGSIDKTGMERANGE